MSSNYYKKGDWNAVCAICGFKYKASQLIKNWKGLYVCREDWEPRHQQDYLKARKEDNTLPFTRPENTLLYVDHICYLWERSAYADLASADCATADYAALPYDYLLALSTGTN